MAIFRDHRNFLRDRKALMLARAEAIESYANLENVLCKVFTEALETRPDPGGVVFYNLIGSHATTGLSKGSQSFAMRAATKHSGTPLWSESKDLMALETRFTDTCQLSFGQMEVKRLSSQRRCVGETSMIWTKRLPWLFQN